MKHRVKQVLNGERPVVTSPASDLPPEFLKRLEHIVAPDDQNLIKSFMAQPRPMSIRLTDATLNIDEVSDALRDVGYEPSKIPWMPEALLLTPADRSLVREVDYYQRGSIFIQSLSSMAAVEAMQIQPGHDVLDCCAAPGGKTSLMRYRQKGKGILVANDLSRRRLQKLKSVLEQHRITRVDLQAQAAETLGGSHANCFDRVLLDAPCSGEGRFHVSNPSSWADWETGKIRRLCKLQQRLLRSALQTLRPGGVLIYATCTLAPEENEVVLAKVMATPPVQVELERVELDCPGLRAAHGSWDGQDFPDWMSLACRIVPEQGMTPFFMARIRRI